MRFSRLALLCAGTVLSMSTPSMAQTNTPAFRVPIGNGAATSSSPPVYAWLESIAECSNTCGSGTRTTSFQCQNAADFDYSGSGYGAPEADPFCTSAVGPKPASTNSACTNYSGCGYDWVKPPLQQTPIRIEPNPIGRVGCGQVRVVFSPYCQRTGGTTPVVMAGNDHRFCRNDTPDYNQVAAGDPDALGYDRTNPQTQACNPTDHEWRTGAYGAWDNECSTTAKQTRSVTCYRKFDNSIAQDSSCDAASKPTASNVQPVYTSCSYDWVNGDEAAWTAWSSTCSNTANRTRNPQCRRSNGDIVADASCVNAGKAKPSTSETQGVYSSCTYAAGGTTTNGAWNSQCSASAQRTVTRQCMRSNGDVVPNAECSNRSVALTSTETQAVYDGCSYSANPGSWGAWSSTCSNSATHTRSVSCRRSDGTDVADAECTNRGIAVPPRSETQAVYDGCTYSAGGSTTYGGWNSGCSANAQRSVNRQCIRSNGDVVSSAECTNRGVAVSSTQSAAIYDACSYRGDYAPWSDWNSHCSNTATRTRDAACNRSDGTRVADAECTNRGIAVPARSETAAVYDGCGFRGDYGPWSDWNSHCSNTATRTRDAACNRSDGTRVADAECTNRGIAVPARSETTGVYDGCGYRAANPGAWSAWNNTCSANAYRSRNYQCVRADGAVVADGECTSRGIGVTEGQNAAVYDGCGYRGDYAPWSDWNSHCSNTATRTRDAACNRSDGTRVADAECTNRGIAVPARSETAGVYDGCGYSRGAYTGSTDWNSHCSGNAVRTNNYNCNRSDGAVVGSAECTNRGISVSEQQGGAVYDQCGYSAVNWTGFSACSNGSQTRTAQCQRSDGAIVANSECDNRGQATTQSQGCSSAPTQCRSPSYGLYVDRGREGAQNFTSSSGAWTYLATQQTQQSYPCGQRLTGSATIMSNGVAKTVSSTCTSAAGSPGCSMTTANVVDGVTYNVWVRLTSYSSSAQSCSAQVSINNSPPAC